MHRNQTEQQGSDASSTWCRPEKAVSTNNQIHLGCARATYTVEQSLSRLMYRSARRKARRMHTCVNSVDGPGQERSACAIRTT